MCSEVHEEYRLTWETEEEFEEEEVREAYRKIQFKRETNKNYLNGFVDHTPTTVLFDEY